MDVFWVSASEAYTPWPYRSQVVGELIHANANRPSSVKSLQSIKYYVFFKGDYSKYSRVFFIKQNNGISKCLCTFLNEVSCASHRVKMF